ncbi:2-deoxystreptamine glucosyltransferase [Aquisphaera giovannonii]|uniref:2-deoxystreptamine glucosyltransferase n=1 Tax=Aquisphaera giovannonii TaxID=406548 RepID=A0A5B9VZW7_9BACT|nr:glycosyltransferase family 4 protein [Aquisphaera giovannonii]QEH33531.1 2-deoxystreptamine glucosyltransferase [Aquisphaera giovannonii]
MVTRRPWFRSGPSPARPHLEAATTDAPRTGPGAQGDGRRAEDNEPGPPGAGRRLLFVNQYYWPDHASTAQHLADLAESLAAKGFECHVLCAQGTYRPGEPKAPAYEVHEGVHIHRVPATSMGRRNTLARMTDYLTFYARAAIRAVLMPRFDAVVTLTTPPIIGLIGTLLRRFKGTRHAFWSMDLHPDASLALKRMSSRNPAVRGLSWLSDLVYRQADRVVVLGPYMADRVIMKGVRTDRVATIPVWSRRDEVFPVEREGNPLRRSLGLEGKVVAMYSGNLGLAHSYDEFLEAARRLRDRDDLVFLFVGGGPRSRDLKAAVGREGLANVHFLDYVPRDQLGHSLSMADIHLISMRPEMTGIVVPGKLYGVMAAGRPALFVGPAHCETADTIRRSGCGFTVPQGDADGVVNALTAVAADPELAARMGRKGRISFLASYERDLCCDQWLDVIRGLLPTRSVVKSSPHRVSGVMATAGTFRAAAR